jgi:SecD/SecF fusion protein
VSGKQRYLGIVLDKKLISAPSINETISNQGQISGPGMDRAEVDFIVSILDAGKLSARLNKVAVSESVISPTLGVETVRKGKQAIVVSLVLVMVFMLVYYRFAGIVACLALSFNLLLVLALMVLIKGAFTLPGLAGLVLTVGMSVDANVIIYERIREELRAGAALRMAIRNGFSRAMSAIIDANVTTIITGLALYAIGTMQVRGFAVTLILGILTSMFTAIFFARLVFDVAERRGWVRRINMMQLMKQPNIDFLRYRYVAGGVSLVLLAIGLAAVFGRGAGLLDIDFRGGSSVIFSFDPESATPIAEVRRTLVATDIGQRNLTVVQHGANQTTYGVDSSIESVDTVKELLVDTFGDRLKTYAVEIGELTPYQEGEFSGIEAKLVFNRDAAAYGADEGISHDALEERLRAVLENQGHVGIRPQVSNPNYRLGSVLRFKDWAVRFTGLDEPATRSVLEQLQSDMEKEPIFPMANIIGERVSAGMQVKALYAIVVSLLGVIGYLWLRFQKVSYGLAAAVATVHDVLITIALLAISKYIVDLVPPLAQFLQIDSFQISLTIVAALLTIMGYSLNDTIVTFDRVREVKGKSPRLTAEMVNLSVNQTLSRTLLTSLTTLIVIVVLYFFGGDGIHSFAFSYLVGIIAGTYSTIYIAAPVLLWLSGSPTGLKSEVAPPPLATAAAR